MSRAARGGALVLAAAATAGCGATASRPATGALGRAVATVAGSAPAPSGAASPSPRRRTRVPPEAIHPAAPPPATAGPARAIVAVAGRFTQAYLRYQIGVHPPAVERALAGTCTGAFAHLLLSAPAGVPAADRHSAAFAPARLTGLQYTGAAALGPGPPQQIVIASYRGLRRSAPRASLTVHVVRAAGGWRVSGLG